MNDGQGYHHSHQMSTPQAQQIKQNFFNHPYTQQAHKFLAGQVSSLDAEVSNFFTLDDVLALTSARQVPRLARL